MPTAIARDLELELEPGPSDADPGPASHHYRRHAGVTVIITCPSHRNQDREQEKKPVRVCPALRLTLCFPKSNATQSVPGTPCTGPGSEPRRRLGFELPVSARAVGFKLSACQ
eukprot:1397006-Rhodomonas_salina.2